MNDRRFLSSEFVRSVNRCLFSKNRSLYKIMLYKIHTLLQKYCSNLWSNSPHRLFKRRRGGANTIELKLYRIYLYFDSILTSICDVSCVTMMCIISNQRIKRAEIYIKVVLFRSQRRRRRRCFVYPTAMQIREICVW